MIKLREQNLLMHLKSLTLLALLTGVIFSFVAPATAAMQDYPVIKMQSIDKITGKTLTFEARVSSTVKYGPLFIKVQACRKAPPIEQPESAAFLQVWEVTPKNESKWVFSGWMFSSSPALSAMDHPIYDVWVLDCLEKKTADSNVAGQDDQAPGAKTEERLEEKVEDMGD